jgi:hypothetical protein
LPLLPWPGGGERSLRDRTALVLDTRLGGTLEDARRIPLGQAVAWDACLTPRTGAGVLVGPDGVLQAELDLVEMHTASSHDHQRRRPPRSMGSMTPKPGGCTAALPRSTVRAGRANGGTRTLIAWAPQHDDAHV